MKKLSCFANVLNKKAKTEELEMFNTFTSAAAKHAEGWMGENKALDKAERLGEDDLFASWIADMIENYGDAIKPYLRPAWGLAKANIKAARRNKALTSNGFDEFEKAVTGVDKNGDPIHARFMLQNEVMEMAKITQDMKRDGFGFGFLGQIFKFEQFDNLNGTKLLSNIISELNTRENLMTIEVRQLMQDHNARMKGIDAEKLGIYAAIKDTPNMDIILQADGVDTSIANTDAKMTPEELEAYQATRVKYDEMLRDINYVRELVGEKPITKRLNYFTFVRLDEYLNKAGTDMLSASIQQVNATIDKLMERDTTDIQKAKNVRFPFINRGKNIKPIDLNFNRVFETYLRRAKRYQHLAPLAARVKEMTDSFIIGKDDNGKSVKFKLADVAPEMKLELEDWMSTVLGARPTSKVLPPAVEDFLDGLSSNIAAATLGFNLRSVIIQPTANALTAIHIGPRWVWRGMQEAFTKEGREFAMQNSRILEQRLPDVQVEVFESGTASRLEKAQKLSFFALQKLDQLTAISGWLGTYKRLTEVEGMDHEEAVVESDRIIQKTHASASRGLRANIQRTPLGRTMTLFQTFVINEFNYITQEVLKASTLTDIQGRKLSETESKAIRTQRVVTMLIMYALINSFYEDVVGIDSPMPGPFRAFINALEDGDDKSTAFMKGVSDIGAQVPIVGGPFKFGGSPAGPVFETMADTFDKIANKKGPKKSWTSIAGRVAGVPMTSQMSKMVGAHAKGGNIYEIVGGFYPDHRRLLIELLAGHVKSSHWD